MVVGPLLVPGGSAHYAFSPKSIWIKSDRRNPIIPRKTKR
jgi:hypothetical protein